MEKKIFVLMMSAIICLTCVCHAEKTDYRGRRLSEALADICKRSPELKISFIYDELEQYVVKGKVTAEDPRQAVREMVALNPVSVTTDGDEIYIEAMQKGKYAFKGRVIDSKSAEPVGYATVMLLNPKDSTAITYGITDVSGCFSIPCDNRNIVAKISSVGYKTTYIPTPDLSMGDVKIDMIALKLGGVEAVAEMRYAESDRTVYTPTAREKNAAQGGAELLQFMAIPSIRVSMIDQSVSTLSGQHVTLFIDYVKASKEEISGLRPQDVRRVEVLDYPADPRFEGVPYAVNFILVKYEYGGYTKLSDKQRLDFKYGYYSLSSKFSYGRMTYDVYTGYDHFKADNEYVNSVTAYDFGSRNVEWKQTTPESEVETNEAYLSTRAMYQTDNTRISNQLSIRRNDTPEAWQVSRNEYTPEIYPSSDSRRTQTRCSLTPSWRGNYQFSLPNSMRLVVTPSATYALNTSNSLFAEDGTELLNNVKENSWNANAGAGLSKNWGRNSLTVSLNGEMSDDRLKYRGDNPSDIHYTYWAAGARVSGSVVFGRLRLQPSARFYYSRTTFDSDHYKQALPGYYISGMINIDRHNQLSFDSEMSNWTIGVSQRSPNIVVRNLLDAVQGNPNLKCWLYNSATVSYSWFPRQALYFSAFGSYIRHTKPMDYSYVPTMIDGREMMLQTYVKDGYFQTVSGGLAGVVRLFNNSLSLEGQAKLNSYRRGGRRQYQSTFINGNVGATYYLRNFYFNAEYEFPEKSASVFYERMDHPSYYTLWCGWSNGQFNISATMRNFFRTNTRKGTYDMVYDNYSRYDISHGSSYKRSVWLTVIYTFGYGKKLKVEQIDRGDSAASGIVN